MKLEEVAEERQTVVRCGGVNRVSRVSSFEIERHVLLTLNRVSSLVCLN